MLEANARTIASAYEANHGGLVRRLTAITRDVGDAEDLTHEAFVRLSVEVEAGRVPEDIGAWLHRVAWNLAMSRGRHRSVVDRRFAELARPDSPATPDDTALQQEACGALAVALGDLSVIERDVLVLAANGYRGEEVASLIGRTEAATRTLLCRVRAKLRARLDPELFATT